MRSLLLLISLVPIAAAQDAASVVKQAIDAHGGAEALTAARMARMSSTGTIAVQGNDVKFEASSVYSIPEKYRNDLRAELSGVKMVASQVLNGKKVKISTKKNGVEDAVDPKLKDETIQSAWYEEVRSLQPLLDAKKYTLKLEKDADINGNPANVVVVSANGLRDVKLFIDKKSHRLVKTQRKGYGKGPGGIVEVDEEVYFSDFKPFGKATLPAAMLVNHDGKKFMAMTITDLKFLDKVDDKEFSTD